MQHTETVSYPSLLKRVQATFADEIITFVLLGVLMTLCNGIDENSAGLKVAAFIIAFSYEPIFGKYLRTLGQVITGTRIQGCSTPKKPPLLFFYWRYAIKISLGWISFLTIHGNDERRAIHDLGADTVVVYN